MISDMHVLYDNRKGDLGQGLSEGEYFFWQTEKRNENLRHRDLGHTNFCETCKNCMCGDKRFVCICPSGKIWVTPYKIRNRGIVGRQ